jgi:Protein kinase domain
MSSHDDETLRVSADPRLTPSGGIDHGRFVPGALVGSRYRIVAMLGKGGMGEVYRADDLLLGQPVALKFLPQRVAKDPARLAQLLAEVRIARQISHPNVCRVYDVGEVGGEHFISMEYVQGEDLGTLLRRIGHLPSERGVQVARQICAGLAAAHDRGVLHRDLKPANVMIDERGVARITDFGLAVLADSATIRAGEGTPAYMAPEQLDGGEITQRSDLYALGLVLHEIFTGHRLFDAKSLPELLEMRKSGSAPLRQDIDPAIGNVIRRCLESDPAKRSPSATVVSAALPGGDPLAAALAAGETPSPELVAAAGEREGVRPAYAVGGLAAAIVLIVGVLVLKAQVMPLRDVSASADEMATHARDLLARAGYTAAPRGRARLFRIDYNRVTFWYRESPRPLLSLAFFRHPAYASWSGAISETSPPLDEPGMSLLRFDAAGRLLSLRVVPPAEVRTASPAPFDWRMLLDAAGLNAGGLRAAPPVRFASPADQRVAWTWHDATSGKPMRAEGAAVAGKPVWFESGPDAPPRVISDVDAVPLLVLFGVTLTLIALLSYRNLRLRRADIARGMRSGAAVAVVGILTCMFGADHALVPAEGGLLLEGLAWAAMGGTVMFFGYIAIEPFMRRRWPQSLVGWTRLLGGAWNDPIVGTEVLAGCVYGSLLVLISALVAYAQHGMLPSFGGPLSGPGYALAEIVSVLPRTIIDAFLYLLLLLIFRALLRNDWLAVGVVAVLFVAVQSLWSLNALVPVSTIVLLYLFVRRFGFLTAVIGNIIRALLILSPSLALPTTWYTPIALAFVVVILAIAFWGFITALAGRPLFSGDLLEA